MELEKQFVDFVQTFFPIILFAAIYAVMKHGPANHRKDKWVRSRNKHKKKR